MKLSSGVVTPNTLSRFAYRQASQGRHYFVFFFNRKFVYDRREQCEFTYCVPNRTRNSVQYYDIPFYKYNQLTFLFVFIRRLKLQTRITGVYYKTIMSQ